MAVFPRSDEFGYLRTKIVGGVVADVALGIAIRVATAILRFLRGVFVKDRRWADAFNLLSACFATFVSANFWRDVTRSVTCADGVGGRKLFRA